MAAAFVAAVRWPAPAATAVAQCGAALARRVASGGLRGTALRARATSSGALAGAQRQGDAVSPAHAVAGVGLPDVATIPDMKSSQLRRLAQAAATDGADPRVWDAIAARCEASAEQLNYWDSVLILQSLSAARFASQPALLRLAEAIEAKSSHLAPKHVLDVLAAYESFGLRPRGLYVELFHTLIRLSRSMYAEELSLTLQALARYRLGSPTVLGHLVQTLRGQLGDMRLLYLCGATGALGALECCPAELLQELDRRARFEVQTVPAQELLDSLKAFPTLEFSWQPYEDLCLEEFLSRVGSFETAGDMDQLVDPFAAMQFLQAKDLLTDTFLLSLCQWCLRGVHRPNVRSERRPTAKQLALLHEVCAERDLEDTAALKDAVLFFVESGGGRWPIRNPLPLQYAKKRNYKRTADPLADLLPDLIGGDDVEAPRLHGSAAALPGLPGLPPVESMQSDLVSGGASALSVAESAALERSYKASGGETVNSWLPSRMGFRPRVRAPVGLPRCDPRREQYFRRFQKWYTGGWKMRPKYHQGRATKKYPWKGAPLGARGGSWCHRR
eukprot:TRINITY_DN5713_c0_g6_i1.p1 TRINITY_DN5713_c0_g6~~TRINITY_DN5713_c0_g6_i1.p1  ORF type:complete len:583 (-),score=120.81 TRINITY_DN5713_c0_g6_i1:226-1902(-)